MVKIYLPKMRQIKNLVMQSINNNRYENITIKTCFIWKYTALETKFYAGAVKITQKVPIQLKTNYQLIVTLIQTK